MRLVLLWSLLAACGASPAGDTDTDTEEKASDSSTLAPLPADPSIATEVDGERIRTDIVDLAIPRKPGSKGWQAAQDRCASVFEAAGLEVERQVYDTGTNVIGRKAGTAPSAKTVLISAHYDSVPRCDGADDNASGVAGVLEAARVLSRPTWDHDLVVACWDEEEGGLIGSQAWVARARADGAEIRVAWSLEMIGYASSEPDTQTLPPGFELLFPDAVAKVSDNDWRGDFITVVGDEGATAATEAFREQAGDLSVVDITLTDAQLDNPLFSDLQRSDHASFWAVGYPAIMVTDTANFRNAAYHCAGPADTTDRLDFDFAASTVRAVVGASAALLAE